MTEPILVETDSRGRVAIGKLGDAERYLATREAGGRIVLEPAVVMTEVEQRLLSDPGWIKRMTKAAGAPTQPLDMDEI